MNLRHGCSPNRKRLKKTTKSNPQNPSQNFVTKNNALECNSTLQSLLLSFKKKTGSSADGWNLYSFSHQNILTLDPQTCEVHTDSQIFI